MFIIQQYIMVKVDLERQRYIVLLEPTRFLFRNLNFHNRQLNLSFQVPIHEVLRKGKYYIHLGHTPRSFY